MKKNKPLTKKESEDVDKALDVISKQGLKKSVLREIFSNGTNKLSSKRILGLMSGVTFLCYCFYDLINSGQARTEIIWAMVTLSCTLLGVERITDAVKSRNGKP